MKSSVLADVFYVDCDFWSDGGAWRFGFKAQAGDGVKKSCSREG